MRSPCEEEFHMGGMPVTGVMAYRTAASRSATEHPIVGLTRESVSVGM